MPLKAIIIGVRGALVDTDELHRVAYNDVFAEARIEWSWDAATYAQLIDVAGDGDPLSRYIARRPQWTRSDDVPKLLAALRRRQKTVFSERIDRGEGLLRGGLADLLLAAKTKNIRLAAVTDMARPDVNVLFQRAFGSVLGPFDAVAANDHDDRAAPLSDRFVEVLERLVLPPSACLAIVGSGGGMAAATTAGIGAVVTHGAYHAKDPFNGAIAVGPDLKSLALCVFGPDLPGQDNGNGTLSALAALHAKHHSSTIDHRVRSATNWSVFDRGVKTMKVGEVLKGKTPGVMTIRPDATMQAFAQRLKTDKVGAMIVSMNGTSLDGIISERDLAFGLADHGADLFKLSVSQLMTKGVITCTPSDSIADVMSIMTQRRIRHVPVRDGDHLVGMISIGDVLKHRLDEMRLEANVLRDYAIARG